MVILFCYDENSVHFFLFFCFAHKWWSKPLSYQLNDRGYVGNDLVGKCCDYKRSRDNWKCQKSGHISIILTFIVKERKVRKVERDWYALYLIDYLTDILADFSQFVPWCWQGAHICRSIIANTTTQHLH